MMYEVMMPPKITISEAMTHHTARRPVGIPAALRVVAIGRADIRLLSARSRGRGSRPASGRDVLRPVVLLAARHAVLVGAAIHARHLVGAPVAVRRRRPGRPLECVGVPRVLARLP